MTEKDVIISILAKTISFKVIKAVILFIDTYKEDSIEVGKEEKNSKQRG